MCGITGFLSFNNFFSEESLSRITRALAHRGPDAEGLFYDGTCGLGHRRLSILDLSESANQPMQSADGSCTIVFNGEVYNYREMAAALRTPAPYYLRYGSHPGIVRAARCFVSGAVQRHVCLCRVQRGAAGIARGPRPARHQAAVLLLGRPATGICFRTEGAESPAGTCTLNPTLRPFPTSCTWGTFRPRVPSTKTYSNSSPGTT
jgi:hypothetical protein